MTDLASFLKQLYPTSKSVNRSRNPVQMMKTALPIILAVALSSLLLSSAVQAQKLTLGIAEVRASDAIATHAAASGTGNSMLRVTQSLDQQLIPALHGTRKFEIMARGDLDRLMEESGATGNPFIIPEADFLVVVSVDDFQDYIETATFEGIGETAQKRILRLSAVAKIYDSSKGSLKETATFQLTNRDVREIPGYSTSSGMLSDSLMTELARMMAGKIANRVVDVLYPARIIARTGPQVTINRGDGSGVETGQQWKVYALGEALVDPDTGDVLGQEEVEVGSVKISQVLPKFCKATVVEDFGIDKGHVVRLQQ